MTNTLVGPGGPLTSADLRRITRQMARSAHVWLYRRTVRTRLRARFYRDDVVVAAGSHLSPFVQIGRRTRINEASYLEPCEIGSYCAIGGRLVVRSANHKMEYLNIEEDAQLRVMGAASTIGERQLVRVGHAVWIGDSVYIGPGVTIGNGAVIGACSVVTKDIPAYAVAVGNPARVIRWRYPEPVIEVLKDFEWWHWGDDRLRRNREIFELDLTTVDPGELAERLRACT